MSFIKYTPTRIMFGQGMLAQLKECQLPGKKALIAISNGKSTRANGFLDRCEALLKEAGVETVVFDKIEPNPLDTTVMVGAEFAKKNGCDFIVALGGGSVMDAAKGIATMATNAGEVWDYIISGTGGQKPISEKPLPLVAITTTAGTGSEVDQWGVINNERTKEKIAFGGLDENYPQIAIVDPELMVTVPPKFTAYQGFDALFHSTEGYLSALHNHMSDMYASTAIKYIGKYLARAVRDGSDMEAREGVAFANNLSGTVMTVSSVTSEHAMEHAMSAYHHDLTHGAGLIMISIEYYQYFIDKHVCDDRFIEMAKLLGKDDATEAQDFITALKDLQKACGVDNLKMSDYGIEKPEMDSFADNAEKTMGIMFEVDPYRMSHDDCVQIYSRSFK